MTPYGSVNSVAIHNGLAAVRRRSRRRAPIPASCCSTTPRRARSAAGVNVGRRSARCPTCSPSRRTAASCWSPTRPRRAPTARASARRCPASSAPRRRSGRQRQHHRHADAARVVATAGFAGVPTGGSNLRTDHRHGLRARVHRGRRGRRQGLRHAAGSQRDRRARPRDATPSTRDRPRRQGLQPAGQRDRSARQRRDRDLHLAGRQGPLHARRHRHLRVARQDLSGDGQRRRLPRGRRRPLGRQHLRRRRAAEPAARLQHRLLAGQPVSPPARARSRSATSTATWSTTAATSSTRRPPPAASTTTAAAATRAWSPKASPARHRRPHLCLHRPGAHDQGRRGGVRHHRARRDAASST